MEVIVGSMRHFTDIDVLHRALAEPFAEGDVEWRVQTSGSSNQRPWVRVLAYVTNRAIMERLDETCGADGWRNEFVPTGPKGMLCGLALKINGEWITKWDGAEQTDIEAVKGSLSGAMKRAAVQWGIGRYLYNVEENFAVIADPADKRASYLKADKQKHGDALRWYPPKLPVWALPKGSGKPGVVSPENAATAARAEAVLKGAHRDKLIPGTAAHFSGHGGKRIGDVDSDTLLKIKLVLIDKGGYEEITDAIDLMVDEREQRDMKAAAPFRPGNVS